MAAVGCYDKVAVLEVTLLRLLLLCQDVAVISVMTLDLTRSGKHETLFGTGIRLYFWHFFVCLNCYLINGVATHIPGAAHSLLLILNS